MTALLIVWAVVGTLAIALLVWGAVQSGLVSHALDEGHLEHLRQAMVDHLAWHVHAGDRVPEHVGDELWADDAEHFGGAS